MLCIQVVLQTSHNELKVDGKLRPTKSLPGVYSTVWMRWRDSTNEKPPGSSPDQWGTTAPVTWHPVLPPWRHFTGPWPTSVHVLVRPGTKRISPGKKHLRQWEPIIRVSYPSFAHDWVYTIHEWVWNRIRETFELNQPKSAPSQLLPVFSGFDRLPTCCHSFGPANILYFFPSAG